MMKTYKVFIDGTWLWHNIMNNSDHNRKFDTGNLPLSLLPVLEKHFQQPMRYVGCVLCTSIAKNVSPLDGASVEKKRRFFSMLSERYNFEIDLYEIDFQGRRLYRKDRVSTDPWSPKEKCVDIATISNLFYYAASYDIAIVITGDRDFLPAFRKLSSMSKSIVIVSFRSSCSTEITAEYPCLWLDDMASLWSQVSIV